MRFLLTATVVALWSISTPVLAQVELTLEDAILKQYSSLGPERMLQLQWIDDTDGYSYVARETPQVLMRGSASGNQKDTELIALNDLNKALGTEMDRFPMVHWQSSSQFRLSNNNVIYFYDVKSKRGKKVMEYEEDAANLDYNTVSGALAYTIDNNLKINLQDKIIAVTKDKEPGIVNGQVVHRYEFGVHTGTFWSPDGKSLAFYRKDESMVSEYPLVDMTKRPAALNNTRYPMAGMASHQVKLGVYSIANGKTVFLETMGAKDDYLTNVAWGPEGKYIYVAELNRDQNHLRFNQFDAQTGKLVKTLFEEKHEKYIEPLSPPHFVPGKADQFIWLSERDGYNHMYLYNTEGTLLRQLTKGEKVVKEIIGFDKEGQNVLCHVIESQGLHQMVYTVDVASSKMGNLSTGERLKKGMAAGWHVGQYNGGQYLIDTYSSRETPYRIRILDRAAREVKLVHDSKDPLENVNVRHPELLRLKAEDGTALNGRLFKPYDFDDSKKYPVVVYVYNGPGVQMVRDRWLLGAPLWMPYLANQGYLVFTVDGRGSDNRGRDFEQATFRKLGTVERKDQLVGVEYLKGLKYVDADRMAIHGWSYGGFMTTNLMLNSPGTFKVGVAGGPVMDWKYYEVMYTERYMDTPQTNPEGFAKASMLDKVDKLDGDLLIIHGAVDDVVLPQHSMDFLKHCVDAGVQVDFFTYPGHPHNVRGKDRLHLYQKVIGYIIDNLN